MSIHGTSRWHQFLPPFLERLGACGAELHLANGAKEQDTLVFQWKARRKGKEHALCIASPTPPDGFPQELAQREPHYESEEDILSLPLQGHKGTLGHLALTFQGNLFHPQPQQRRLAHALAQALGDSLSAEQLWQSLASAEEEVRGLRKALLETKEAERTRLAQDIHDGLWQTLISALQHLQLLRSAVPATDTRSGSVLARSADLIRQSIEETREIVQSMYPASLTGYGLETALRKELLPLMEDWGWAVEFCWQPGIPLDTDTQFHLFRIAREAIANAKTHSGTRRLSVTMNCSDQEAILEVQDWGKGFDPRKKLARAPRKNLGLSGMVKRAKLLGGNCEIFSSLNKGTLIRVRFPIPTARAEPWRLYESS